MTTASSAETYGQIIAHPRSAVRGDAVRGA